MEVMLKRVVYSHYEKLHGHTGVEYAGVGISKYGDALDVVVAKD